MTRRAYRPKDSTRQLVRAIEALDGIERVDIIAPHHGVTNTPARIKVTTEGRDGSGAAIFTTFTLAEARAWLATETETPAERMQREERSGLAGYHTTTTTGRFNYPTTRCAESTDDTGFCVAHMTVHEKETR